MKNMMAATLLLFSRLWNFLFLFSLVTIVVSCKVSKKEVASNLETPKGVIFILLDDIGYGEIDTLYPSDLETPNFDKLCHESIRLTDFHVGTSCSPSRASIMTGRSVNAGGVWHTVASRDVLRANEQTIAEVFQHNGWRTGIFGKWHLGDGYPFSPRFRGFDVAMTHGGGGIGQQPDYWGNDYYSDVDFDGNPSKVDKYLSNGKLVDGKDHCTDFWFNNAKHFIKESISSDKPFFCYIPTNAPHYPFNAPQGYKKGYDGLLEHIDVNVGKLEAFLEELGVKDDVMLVFSSDNGTSVSKGAERFGGLRGGKISRYDGGHNVPCFIRWKKGGVAGSAKTARDLPYLTAGMDLFPTFMDMFGLEKPDGGQPLHGMSIKNMLLDSTYVPSSRTVFADTQRAKELEKWKNTCVVHDEIENGKIKHKWRLVRQNQASPLELFDFNVDRDTNENIIENHPDVVSKLTQDYNAWWDEILSYGNDYPNFVLNDDYEKEAVLYSMYWAGLGGAPWSQGSVKAASRGSRTHHIKVEKPGTYRFELRRWPREDGGAIDSKSNGGGGRVLSVKKAQLSIPNIKESIIDLRPGDVAATFQVELPEVETTVTTAFLNENDKVLSGAYYVYVKRLD